MKAILCRRSGPPDVLKFEEIEKPVPGENEILLEVYASTVTRGDTALRKIPRFILAPMGLLLGFKSKKISGVEFAGVVESVGKNVTLFKPGDRAFGTTTGLSAGGNAEYVCVPEKWKHGVVAKIPDNVSFTEAAAMPVGFMTACHLLKKANISSNQSVLIHGASGSVGTYAVQLAKYSGTEVTAVCSTSNIGMVKGLGADYIIDYTKEDYTNSRKKFDLVFDAAGKTSRRQCKQLLKPGGIYVSVKSPTKEKQEYMELLIRLAGKGKIRAVIDREFTLEQVPDAHRYVDTGRKKGNVVIRIK